MVTKWHVGVKMLTFVWRFLLRSMSPWVLRSICKNNFRTCRHVIYKFQILEFFYQEVHYYGSRTVIWGIVHNCTHHCTQLDIHNIDLKIIQRKVSSVAKKNMAISTADMKPLNSFVVPLPVFIDPDLTYLPVVHLEHPDLTKLICYWHTDSTIS